VARVVDASSGEHLLPPIPHRGPVLRVSLSPNGARLVTAMVGLDTYPAGEIRVWNLTMSKTFPLVPQLGPTRSIFRVVNSDWTNRTALTDGKVVRVWDLDRGVPLTPPIEHEKPIYRYVFNADSTKLVTLGVIDFQSVSNGHSLIRVWDVKTAKELIPAIKNEGLVRSLAICGDGSRLVTESYGTRAGKRFQSAWVWDLRTGTLLIPPLVHDRNVSAVAISSGGAKVITGSVDGYARVWEANTGKLLFTTPKQDQSVSSLAISPDAAKFLSGSYFGTVQVWDFATGQPIGQPVRHVGSMDLMDSIVVTPDGSKAVTRSYGGTVRIWSLETGRDVVPPLKSSLAVSRDATRYFERSTDEAARVVELPSGEALTRPLRFGRFAAFNRDMTRLVAPSGVWEIPPWFLDLAEAFAGVRVNESGFVEPVPSQAYLDAQDKILEMNESAGIVAWAKWLVADRRTRTVAPSLRMTIPQYVERQIEQNSLESLREAVFLSPTNGLAFARLARLVSVQDPKENPRRIGEADFLSRRAVELAPDTTEVIEIRKAVLEAVSLKE